MSINWRLASRFSVLTLAVLVVIVVALWGTRTHSGAIPDNSASTSNPAGMQGTDLGNVPAPDFRLTDQLGKPVSLSQFKGKPVVLTFLYTQCPDQCPLTAEKLRAAMQNLGSDAQRVGILAVSTDPKRDTAKTAQDFTKVHHMQNYWHFLIGSHSELAPVWSSYSVYAAPQATSASIAHTTGIFVIDKQGHERVFFGDSATSAQLVTDLKILLSE